MGWTIVKRSITINSMEIVSWSLAMGIESRRIATNTIALVVYNDLRRGESDE